MVQADFRCSRLESRQPEFAGLLQVSLHRRQHGRLRADGAVAPNILHACLIPPGGGLTPLGVEPGPAELRTWVHVDEHDTGEKPQSESFLGLWGYRALGL